MTPVHFRTVFLKSRIKVSRIHFKNVCNFTGKDEYLKTENILGEKNRSVFHNSRGCFVSYLLMFASYQNNIIGTTKLLKSV